MELADAFNGFQPTLRELLRDTAAREEKDAQALGEVEATRLRAEKRLGELDKVLKQKVDSGELPAVRLPAAQRGAAFRVGQEHAEVGLQTYLDQKAASVVNGEADMEEVINEGLRTFASNIPGGAFFERQGFDKAAEQIVANWRSRTSRAREAEVLRFQEETRANQGTELAFQLATAPVDQLGAARDQLKAHFDASYAEMPKADVTEFFGKRVIAPAVARLIDARDFTAAEQLLEEARNIKAGSGTYGGTARGAQLLSELAEGLDVRRRTAHHADAERLGNDAREAELVGLNAAAAVLAEMRQQNGGKLLPADRQKLIQEGTARGLSPLALQKFVAVVNGEFESDERFRLDPAKAAKLIQDANTLDGEALDLVKGMADGAFSAGEISGEQYLRTVETVNRNRSLSGLLEDRDVLTFQRAVFAAPSLLGRGETTIDVGDSKAVPVWDRMAEPEKEAVRAGATSVFVATFQDQLRLLSGGKPENVAAIKAQAWDRASTAAQRHAASAILAKPGQAAEAAALEKVREYRETIARVRSLFPLRQAVRFRNDFPESVRTPQTVSKSPALDLLGSSVDLYGLNPAPKLTKQPGEEDAQPQKSKPRDLAATLEAQRTMPPAEWDVVVLPEAASRMLARESKIKRTAVDLAALASDLDPESQRYYAVAKGLTGFTPDEIKAKKTKHGVPFDPAEIDFRVTPVFRDVAELRKAWNDGKLSPLFEEVGDLIDPADKMTPEQFYLAQRALLSARN